MFFTGNISSPVPLQLHSGHSTNVIITMWKEETTSRSFILSTGTEIQADSVMYGTLSLLAGGATQVLSYSYSYRILTVTFMTTHNT